MKKLLKPLHWLLRVQMGLDPLRILRAFKGMPRYVANWIAFRKRYSGRLGILPCLHDWVENNASTTDEYFWQDLHVARLIYRAKPTKHVDIGSRIDGFVAHVASFREIEVFDIRPLGSAIPGVVFKRSDLMNPADTPVGYCDSLSCLHALEHFGLGRYGDPVDPQGYASGLNNMARMLLPGGRLYLSVPSGEERVEFNAHRIFNPHSLVRLAATNGLTLQDFAWIRSGQTLVQSSSIEQDMDQIAGLPYTLCILTFVKQ